tara:strand:- start:486 stop:947 length:462 start_codon:yes stop_codon:yes gene_type:complete
MAITSTYPIILPKPSDLIVGTQTYTSANPVLDNPTKNFTVQSLVDLAVGGTYLSLAGGTIEGSLAIDGDLTLKVDGNGFAKIKTNTTGTVMIGDASLGGVTTGLNITGDITMQSSNASINLTSPTAAIYMMSPDMTYYKVTMGNGGVFVITQA